MERSTAMNGAKSWVLGLQGEAQSKEIDFSPAGIGTRRDARYVNTQRMLERGPWRVLCDLTAGLRLAHSRTRKSRRQPAIWNGTSSALEDSLSSLCDERPLLFDQLPPPE
jgi:hypothetical protein